MGTPCGDSVVSRTEFPTSWSLSFRRSQTIKIQLNRLDNSSQWPVKRRQWVKNDLVELGATLGEIFEQRLERWDKLKKWEKFLFSAEDTASAKALRQNGVRCIPGREEGYSQRGVSHEGRAERQRGARSPGTLWSFSSVTYSKWNGLSKGYDWF